MGTQVSRTARQRRRELSDGSSGPTTSSFPMRSGDPAAPLLSARAIARPTRANAMAFEGRWPSVRQIDKPASPSRSEHFSCGRSPLFQRAAVCTTRYRIGPPSGRSLRVTGRGMQTNSVRISSADKRTFA